MHVSAFDVSKSELVYWSSCQTGKLSNQERPIRGFLSKLPKGSTVALEASGRYHMPLANLAHEMGFRVVVANPRRVSAIVRSTRSRGKTDRTDARSLARYVQSQCVALRVYSPPPEHASKVRDLVRQRQALIDARASLEQSLIDSPQALAVACQGIKQAIATLDKQLKACLC